MQDHVDNTVVLSTVGFSGLVGFFHEANWILIGTGVLLLLKIVHEAFRLYKSVKGNKHGSE